MAKEEYIVVKGARVNNLKNVSAKIPRGKIIVVTGVSGSGKTSFAFDTLYAEGQRRFAQSLSSYARQFLGRMSKPDVDSIEGLPPAVAISQKVKSRNPRSSVATTTEIYDFLRKVYTTIGRTISPISGQEVKCHTQKDVYNYIVGTEPQATDPQAAQPAGSTRIYILADLGYKSRKDHTELLLELIKEGFSRLYNLETGTLVRAEELIQQDDPRGDYYLMIDRLAIEANPETDLSSRVLDSINLAFSKGQGRLVIVKDGEIRHFSNRFEADGITFEKPNDYLFSFNSPLGACPTCGGFGLIDGISEDLVIPDQSLSIYDKCIAPFRGEKMSWFNQRIILNSQKYNIPIFEPYCNLSQQVKDILWKGARGESEEENIYGINEYFAEIEKKLYKIQNKYMLARYSGRTTCPDCHGARLKKEALYVQVAGKNIAEVLDMTCEEALNFFKTAQLDAHDSKVVESVFKEIISRLECIQDVGLGYLKLNRASNTLSGGESQRIALVTALGSSLVGSMYVLDEPSIGLHSRDTHRLIKVLKRLRDLGNTIIVVEHDKDIMEASDEIIDIGPKAGDHGGEIVLKGNLTKLLQGDAQSLTLDYFRGARQISKRAKLLSHKQITLKGVMHHNLRNATVHIPLNVLTVVTGVSGSGKSSLVGDVLYPALARHFDQQGAPAPGTFKSLEGDLKAISKVEYIDQSSIGKSSRSNPVTYLKVYDDIRKLMASQQYAQINNYTPGHFSFNTDGGRCPECEGEGVIHVGMQFMSDVTVVCTSCGGKRFKPDILQVKFQGKNINDILDLTCDEAIKFFGESSDNYAKRIATKLQPLVDVGLGYVRLGQSNSTLSGGESQRVKLAYFLSSACTEAEREKILFIFDEPTTGLHFYDIEKLLKAFDALLAKGHSLLVVEHNTDVIRSADYIIDLGPDAGDRGGEIVYEGPLDGIYTAERSITRKFI